MGNLELRFLAAFSMLAEATWPWRLLGEHPPTVPAEVAGMLFFFYFYFLQRGEKERGLELGGLTRLGVHRLCVKFVKSFSVSLWDSLSLTGKAPFAQREGSAARAVDWCCEAKEGNKGNLGETGSATRPCFSVGEVVSPQCPRLRWASRSPDPPNACHFSSS